MVILLKGAVITLVISLLLGCTRHNGRNVTHASVEQEGGQDASFQADISFDTLFHDFGTIIEGEIVVCYFDYVNRGKSDLLVSSVETSCGCTSPDWNREPLKPGERGQLKVVFDAHGRSGAQLKSVNVVSNSLTPTIRLSVKANVTINK